MANYIRNKSQCTTDEFKRLLDDYLLNVPDKPRLRGYTALCRSPSNSLADMVLETEETGQPHVEVPEELIFSEISPQIQPAPHMPVI